VSPALAGGFFTTKASGPITSWEIDGETGETVADFILGGSKITAEGDCSQEIKRDTGSIPGSGRSPGGGNGNPLQYSYLENSIDRWPGRLQSMGSKRVEHN